MYGTQSTYGNQIPASTKYRSHMRDSAFSQSRGREDERRRRKGEEGENEATFFPEEGGFRGAWVKSLECDCVAVHEKSASHMPLPPH